MSAEYSEDILVQQTTADFFENTLKWHCVYAYNQETFGIDGTLGRKDKKEIVLKRYLQEALAKINPGHPQQVYDDAIEQLTSYNTFYWFYWYTFNAVRRRVYFQLRVCYRKLIKLLQNWLHNRKLLIYT